MRSIPPKGSIPASIRRKRAMISFGINIGGLGMARPQSQSNDFTKRIKARVKFPPKRKFNDKIDFNDLKEWVIKELAFLLELTKGDISAETIESKKKWLLNFIPESLIEEIIKAAQELYRGGDQGE